MPPSEAFTSSPTPPPSSPVSQDNDEAESSKPMKTTRRKRHVKLPPTLSPVLQMKALSTRATPQNNNSSIPIEGLPQILPGMSQPGQERRKMVLKQQENVIA